MRRTWIKLFCDQVLRGSCFRELKVDERYVWFGFLLLAGDSGYDGKIQLVEDIGYTDLQLSKLLKCDVDLIVRAKKKMLKYDKIKVEGENIIIIVNWKKYQSEYERQKPYRKVTR